MDRDEVFTIVQSNSKTPQRIIAEKETDQQANLSRKHSKCVSYDFCFVIHFHTAVSYESTVVLHVGLLLVIFQNIRAFEKINEAKCNLFKLWLVSFARSSHFCLSVHDHFASLLLSISYRYTV